MKKHLILLLLFLPVLVFAQTQGGMVKTIGRPGKPGQPVSGVTVRVSGVHNPILSGNKGQFNFVLPKEEEVYSFLSVRKSGYELADKDFLSQRHAFSSEVPVIIALVSQKQLEEESFRIEQKAYAVAEYNYKARVDSLQAQIELHAENAEMYRQQLQDLEEQFTQFESLVGQLAQRYARADYDALNEIDRRINQHIESGEMFEAQRLILSILNPETVVEENRKAKEELAERRLEEKRIVQMNNQFETDILAKQASDAKHLYDLYTIAIHAFQNDLASFYLEQRALLDTTSVEWQLDAGNFLRDHLAQYDKAQVYLERALRMSRMPNQQPANELSCLIALATLDDEVNDYGSAGIRYEEALDLIERNPSIPNEELALAFQNYAVFLTSLSEWDSASFYFRKAYDAAQDNDATDRVGIRALIGLCNIEKNKGNYSEAMECIMQARDKLLANNDVNNDLGIGVYNELGSVSMKMQKPEDAKQMYQRALEIAQEIYGAEHPTVARCMNNIAVVASELGNDELRLFSLEEAVRINLAVFGELHSQVASNYSNLGVFYYDHYNYQTALDYFLKAVRIYESILGTERPSRELITIYRNCGLLLVRMNRSVEGRESMEKALVMAKNLYGEQHPIVADTYVGIATTYSPDNAETKLAMYKKAQAIYESAEGEYLSEQESLHSNIGLLYANQGEYDKAIEELVQAVEFGQRMGYQTRQLIITIQNLASVYEMKGDYEQALTELSHAEVICRNLYGENSGNYAMNSYGQGRLYQKMGNHLDAARSYSRFVRIMVTIQGPDNNEVLAIVFQAYQEWIQALSGNPSDESVRREAESFMEDKMAKLTITKSDGPVGGKGYKGYYWIVSLNGWNSDDLSQSMMDVIQNTVKDMALWQDDVLYNLHHEGSMGCNFSIGIIDPELKKKIMGM